MIFFFYRFCQILITSKTTTTTKSIPSLDTAHPTKEKSNAVRHNYGLYVYTFSKDNLGILI